jgi:hypothetical protein
LRSTQASCALNFEALGTRFTLTLRWENNDAASVGVHGAASACHCIPTWRAEFGCLGQCTIRSHQGPPTCRCFSCPASDDTSLSPLCPLALAAASLGTEFLRSITLRFFQLTQGPSCTLDHWHLQEHDSSYTGSPDPRTGNKDTRPPGLVLDHRLQATP